MFVNDRGPTTMLLKQEVPSLANGFLPSHHVQWLELIIDHRVNMLNLKGRACVSFTTYEVPRTIWIGCDAARELMLFPGNPKTRA